MEPVPPQTPPRPSAEPSSEGASGGVSELRPSPSPRRRRWVIVAFVALLLIVLGLVAGTWWIGSPQAPVLDDLSAPPSAKETLRDGLEAEQQAFDEAGAERIVEVDEGLRRAARERERAIERERLRRVDLTDHAAITYLAGAWRLDFGRRRGVRVQFGDRSHDIVARDTYTLTTYPVAGVGWPYYTVFALSDGRRMVAFLDEQGTFRQVLEDVEMRPPNRVVYRAEGRSRRQGKRLDR